MDSPEVHEVHVEAIRRVEVTGAGPDLHAAVAGLGDGPVVTMPDGVVAFVGEDEAVDGALRDLEAAVATAGGTIRVRRNLLRVVVTGAGLTHLEDVITRYLVEAVGGDGRIWFTFLDEASFVAVVNAVDADHLRDRFGALATFLQVH